MSMLRTPNKAGMLRAHSHASLQAVSWGFHYSEKPGLTD